MTRLMHPPVIVASTVESVMSRLSRYTVYDIERERETQAARSMPIEVAPLYLSPAQEFALLILRRSDLSKLIVAKLYHSTVAAPSPFDFDSLVPLNLAKRIPPRFSGDKPRHELLPHGHYKANEIALRMSQELGVKVPRFTPRRSSSYGRASGFSARGNA